MKKFYNVTEKSHVLTKIKFLIFNKYYFRTHLFKRIKLEFAQTILGNIHDY